MGAGVGDDDVCQRHFGRLARPTTSTFSSLSDGHVRILSLCDVTPRCRLAWSGSGREQTVADGGRAVCAPRLLLLFLLADGQRILSCIRVDGAAATPMWCVDLTMVGRNRPRRWEEMYSITLSHCIGHCASVGAGALLNVSRALRIACSAVEGFGSPGSQIQPSGTDLPPPRACSHDA